MTSVLFARRLRPTSLSLALLLAVGVGAGLASCSGDDPAAAAPDPDAGTGGPSAGGGGEPDASSLSDSGMAGTGGLGNLPDGALPDGSSSNPDAEVDSGGDGDPNGDGDVDVDSGPPCVIPAGAGNISAPPAPTGDASVPVCWGMSWSSGNQLSSASTSEDDTLGSVSADDLNIAWLAISADAGSEPVIHYANRHYPTDPFSTAFLLDPGADADLAAGMALSTDGLRLVVVLPDRKGFTEYSRNNAEDPFSASPSPTQFDTLNTQISHYLPPGALCGDPVLSADDLTFYFSVYGVDDTSGNYGGYVSDHTIYSSTRIPYVSWPQAEALQGEVLEAHCSSRRRPTGISSDQLTLFYWDEISDSARAAFRPSVDEPFNGALDLGDRPFAQPNPDCTLLYYSGTDVAADTDILTAD